VLFDVEGFFCPKKQDSVHDLKLFALASLTSSMLIYNTLATINSCGLSDLHFGSQLSREFIPESENQSELSKYYPILVWTIRDHFLDLTVEKMGKPLQPPLMNTWKTVWSRKMVNVLRSRRISRTENVSLFRNLLPKS
jgi:hypothetical protein